jgi:non-homologous end joining protein Ku
LVKAVPKVAHKPTGNVVDLTAALRASIKNEGANAPTSKPTGKAHVGGAQLGSRFPGWRGNRMKTSV